ncbi:MAG TPA: hypothetical protein VK821_20820, partial [Dehalococcoidia bacterium]|nr:hypothetical protein [Dehalococcoidia bacterium]
MDRSKWIGSAILMFLATACDGNRPAANVAPTFTPAPSASIARPSSPSPAQAVVRNDCLRGLTSYRFAGSFSLRSATPTEAGLPAAPQGGALAGSLANLLSDVSFQGAAQAPDRYQATIGFGGGGVQTMQIVRVGPQSYSRFGSGAWQAGDQSEGLGAVGQLDPETLCERSLVPLSAAGQHPVYETV